MASSTAHHDARIAQMTFASVYPHYVTKVVKKGRTEPELRTVISWLTGMDDAAIDFGVMMLSLSNAFDRLGSKPT